MRYDKLVRDRIPEIIAKRGEKAVTHVADEAEYWTLLKRKLQEEAAEFVRDESVGEIADVLEVVRAICAFRGFDMAEIERVRAKKAEERGGFSGRIVLDES